ncbi:hypothetical protein GGX14DRAFT_701879 [Mycena pura]|uniref:O-methyltransferase C-terminal domain-containing protein n=1 Tax=Mycena pura TaxID=153505 RepID=A0AAD6Y3M0_9AGAR|nr:hypothetical protein GGX14DRAFT_701879 [Mycena pura]
MTTPLPFFCRDPPRPAFPASTCRSMRVYHPAHHSPPAVILPISVSPTEDKPTSYLFPAGVAYDMLYVLTGEHGDLRSVAQVPRDAPFDESYFGPIIDRACMLDAATVPELVYTVGGNLTFEYPLYRNFVNWPLPAKLPDHWRVHLQTYRRFDPNTSPVSDGPRTTRVITLDGACVMTGYQSRNAIEFTHVVSIGEKDSENRKWLERYLPSAAATNPETDLSNGIALLSALNGRGLDAAQFIFFPDPTHPGEQYVAVWTGGDLREYAMQYNLTRVTLPARIHPSSVFARFAMNTFMLFEQSLPWPGFRWRGNDVTRMEDRHCPRRRHRRQGGQGDDGDSSYEDEGQGKRTRKPKDQGPAKKPRRSPPPSQQTSRPIESRRAVAAAAKESRVLDFAGPLDLNSRLDPDVLRRQAKQYNRIVATGGMVPDAWLEPQPDREIVAAYLAKYKKATDPGNARVGRLFDGYTSERASIKHIMHDWSDENCKKILMHLWDAAGPDTRLLLFDFIMPLACHDPSAKDLAGIPGTAPVSEAPAPLLANYGAVSTLPTLWCVSPIPFSCISEY